MSEPLLTGAHGSAKAAIGAVVGQLLDAGPALVWCEPTPTEKRLNGFFGLWTKPGEPRPWLDRGTALDEARLFWTREAVHLVAAGDQTRWAAFWEFGSAGDPDWLKVLTGLPGAEVNRPPIPDLRRSERKVLPLQKGDANRYGIELSQTNLPAGLTVTEYRSGTELVFWHLRAEGGR